MGEPAHVLQALARDPTRTERDTETAKVVLATHQILGLVHEQALYGCPLHQYEEIAAGFVSKGINPLPLKLVTSTRGRPTVQEVFNSMAADVRGGQASKSEERKCPLCHHPGSAPNGRTQGTKTTTLEPGQAELFFAMTQSVPQKSSPDTGIAPSHGLEAFGDTYSLCGVVYITAGGHHFETQFFLPEEGWWMTYNDRKDSEATCLPSFDADYCRGQEHMFLYIRSDLLRRLNCHNRPCSIPFDSYRSTHVKEDRPKGQSCPRARPVLGTTAIDAKYGKEKASQVRARQIFKLQMLPTANVRGP